MTHLQAIQTTNHVSPNIFVDTQICTHDLIKEDDWIDQSYTQNS